MSFQNQNYCTNMTNSSYPFECDLFWPSLHLFKTVWNAWLKRFLIKFWCCRPIFEGDHEISTKILFKTQWPVTIWKNLFTSWACIMCDWRLGHISTVVNRSLVAHCKWAMYVCSGEIYTHSITYSLIIPHMSTCYLLLVTLSHVYSNTYPYLFILFHITFCYLTTLLKFVLHYPCLVWDYK